MRVTAVVPLDKRRSKVLLDQDFAFVLYTGERRRYRIEEGAELSEETWREIRDQVLAGRAKERALYLLERCGRTEREIAQKLQEGMYPPEVIRDTLEGLKRLGCLVIEPEPPVTPVVSFGIPGISPGEAGDILAGSYDIICRTGLHCAPAIMENLEMPGGTIRLSLSRFTCREELDTVLEAVEAIVESMREGA